MPATYDSKGLFVFEPELDIGLRAGAFNGYGGVNNLDDTRKRGALETWMSNVRHDATTDPLAKKTSGSGYLDWFVFDLNEIGIKTSQAKFYWDTLRLVVNHNNDVTNVYNEAGVKENLEKFNQFWNSEHRQIAEALGKLPYKEGTGEWNVVHANQQPGLKGLFAAGILTGKLPLYAGHVYTNQQGRGGKLPNRPAGYWAHDYPTGKASRGAARVVLGPVKSPTDPSREVWFTDTHYATFVRVMGGSPLVRKPH